MKVRDREYLRKTLEHTGLSYRELAARAGVSHAVIANLAREGGRPSCSASTARSISAAVGVDVRLLFLSDVCATDVQDNAENVTVQGLREGEAK